LKQGEQTPFSIDPDSNQRQTATGFIIASAKNLLAKFHILTVS